MNTMRKIVSQSLHSVRVVSDEEVLEMPQAHQTRCDVPIGRGSHVGIYCYRKTSAVAKHDAFRALGSNSVLKHIPLFFFVWSLLFLGRNLRLLFPNKFCSWSNPSFSITLIYSYSFMRIGRSLFAEYSPRKAPAVAVRPGFLGQ